MLVDSGLPNFFWVECETLEKLLICVNFLMKFMCNIITVYKRIKFNFKLFTNLNASQTVIDLYFNCVIKQETMLQESHKLLIELIVCLIEELNGKI